MVVNTAVPPARSFSGPRTFASETFGRLTMSTEGSAGFPCRFGRRAKETDAPSIPALIDEVEPATDEPLVTIAAVDSSLIDGDLDDAVEGRAPRATPAPGDGLIAVSTAAMAGISAVGLGIALAGRVLRFPRLPASVQGAVVALDHQPRLRRLLEERIGKRTTDTAMGLASTAANALAVAPSILAIDLAINTFKAAEARADARAWSRREPELVRPTTGSDEQSASRPVSAPVGPIEQHLQRSTWVQAIGAAVAGAASRDPNLAGNAALVAVPKAARSTQESFAATLGRGLANNDEALQIDPDGLRRLDRIDVVIIDPQVLRSDS